MSDKPANIIGGSQPAHVKGWEWEVQCARCGSSLASEECDACGGVGVDGHDCGEDCCCCEDPEPNIRCAYCRGRGHFWQCMSSNEWCQSNPLPGREKVPSRTPEWYAVPEPSDE